MSVSLSTHVLDTSRGKPASGVQVALVSGEKTLATGATDEDGRISELATGLDPGAYRLIFFPPSPFVTRLELQVELAAGHHHIPLLVSPYGCVIYRGS